MKLKEEFNICRTFRPGYLWRGLFRSLLFRKKIFFYYLIPAKRSRFLNKALSLFLRIVSGRVLVEELPFDTLEMFNEKGESIIMKASYSSAENLIDLFDEKYFDAEYSIFNYLNKKLSSVKDDLKIWMNFYVTLDIFDSVSLVDIVEWLLTSLKSGLRGKDVRLILERKHHWANLVRDYADSKKVPVVMANIGNSADKIYFLNGIYSFINIFISWLFSLFSFRKADINAAGNTVCTFNEGAANFTDFYNYKNYSLFWLPFSGINPSSISIVSTSSLNIQTKDIESSVQMGFDIVSGEGLFKRVNKGITRYRCSFKALIFFGEYIWESLRLLLKVKSRSSFESWKCLNILFFRLPFWEDFFLNKKVKILFKPGSIFCHRDIAARLSGAATISYQISNFFRTMAGHADSCDIFFVWGEEPKKVYSTKYSRVRNFIQTGYIFDYVFDSGDKRSKDLRKFFSEKGVDLVLSLFDENLADPIFIVNRGFRENIALLYKSLFSYALAYPGVGIIIKPKRDSNIIVLRSIPEINEIMCLLEEKGMLKISDSREFPSVAGKASDLAIGLVAESTAALECWLSGVPAIFYDVNAAKDFNPIYAHKKNIVVFDDIKKMISAIDKYRNDRRQDDGFADLSPFINSTDAFRDNNASKRLGFYIGHLFTCLNKGLTKEIAIADANQSYAEKFGQGKI